MSMENLIYKIQSQYILIFVIRKRLFAIIVDSNEVGIDVEKIKDINLKIADRYFTKNERNYIYATERNKINHNLLCNFFIEYIFMLKI